MSKIALSGNASGTGTFTIASPNSNTDRTLTMPDASGTVALTSQLGATNVQTFNSSGTWTKPDAGSMARIQVWGAGAGGSRQATTTDSFGGGGGGYSETTVLLSSLGSTVTVTIGAGGVGRTATNGIGTSGGTSTFGTLLGASGGIAGNTSINAYGGKTLASDLTVPLIVQRTDVTNFWVGGVGTGATDQQTQSVFGGGGGGGVISSTVGLGGVSSFGGFGGAGSRTAPNNGLAPGGGGGGSNNSINGGDGAAGRVIVTVW